MGLSPWLAFPGEEPRFYHIREKKPKSQEAQHCRYCKSQGKRGRSAWAQMPRQRREDSTSIDALPLTVLHFFRPGPGKWIKDVRKLCLGFRFTLSAAAPSTCVLLHISRPVETQLRRCCCQLGALRYATVLELVAASLQCFCWIPKLLDGPLAPGCAVVFAALTLGGGHRAGVQAGFASVHPRLSIRRRHGLKLEAHQLPCIDAALWFSILKAKTLTGCTQAKQGQASLKPFQLQQAEHRCCGIGCQSCAQADAHDIPKETCSCPGLPHTKLPSHSLCFAKCRPSGFFHFVSRCLYNV